MDALKPCTFCGANASIVRMYPSDAFYKVIAHHKGNCVFKYMRYGYGIAYATREDAVEAWNRRVNE